MYMMHIMSPHMKTPAGLYKEHTSRSILDVRGLAFAKKPGCAAHEYRYDESQVAGPTSPPLRTVTNIHAVAWNCAHGLG
jgi:hypothetical protein